MRKGFRSLCFVGSLLSVPVLAGEGVAEEGVDERRLWLPKDYERLYLDLKESAEAAYTLDRCTKVMRGTIDLAQSTREHPIFRIQCRQHNGRTYNEMVDGLSKKTLTTVEVDEGQDESMLENQEKLFWAACKQAFEDKTRLFSGLRVRQERPLAERLSMDGAKYIIEFDAQDMYKEALMYKAICTVKGSEAPAVTVRKRRSQPDQTEENTR